MSDTPVEPTKDSLGLDLDSLKIGEDQQQPEGARSEQAEKLDGDAAEQESATSPSEEPIVESASEERTAAGDDKKPAQREKRKPYVNLERVKTGGAQRDKLTEEELTERMARIREQNEKIKQRRLDVEEDEREFKKKQEAERAKIAKSKKVQETIDRTREQNARRKMEKITSREWDSGKPGVKKTNDSGNAPSNPPQTGSIGIRGVSRGGASVRGRGRGAGASTSQNEVQASETVATPDVTSS